MPEAQHTPERLRRYRGGAGDRIHSSSTRPALAKRVPASISNLSEHQLDNIKALLDSASVRPPFLYAVLLVMSQLAAPWQLIRLATKAAGTDESNRVAESPYAVTITAVLAVMEAMVWRLDTTLKAADIQWLVMAPGRVNLPLFAARSPSG
jgi:hypothetical protein